MLAAAALVGYGLWVVSGITRFDVPGDESYFVVRQGFAAAVGVVGLVVAALVPIDLWRRYWKLVYGATLALMVVVFVAAEAIRGSQALARPRRHPVPAVRAREGAVRARDRGVRRRPRRVRSTRWRTIVSVIGLGAAPILLVFMQPDLGTALVYAASLFAVLFFVGVRWRQLVVLLALGVLGDRLRALAASRGRDPGPQAVSGRAPHARSRAPIPGGITYNLNQSITAVGSGGLTGRGVVEASQTRLDYLPEHATDFAFASLAEQRGFVGCAILLLLYLLVVWRGLRVITGARRSLRRRRRRRARGRLPLPGVRERRHDDGRRAGHGHPAAVRDGRRLVDGRRTWC